MKEPGVVYCADCGAEQHASDRGLRCWLCRADLAPSEALSQVPVAAPIRARRTRRAGGSGGNAVVLVSCLLLAVGAFLTEPGLGIMLGLFMLPAVIGISRANSELRARGRRASTSSIIGALLISGMVAGGIATLAALGALLLICSGGEMFLDADGFFFLGGLLLLGALGAGLYMGSRVAKQMVVAGSKTDEDTFE